MEEKSSLRVGHNKSVEEVDGCSNAPGTSVCMRL